MIKMVSLFKVLGNDKRRDMLKLLMREEMHLSGIARTLKISVPVALRHIKKLEDEGLVLRHKMGNTHVFRINEDRMEKLSALWFLLDEPFVLKAKKGTALSEILKTMPEIVIKKTKQGSYIDAVDGRKGFFVYEINGEVINTPINKYVVDEDLEIEIKRLLPALDKKIRIKAV